MVVGEVCWLMGERLVLGWVAGRFFFIYATFDIYIRCFIYFEFRDSMGFILIQLGEVEIWIG